MKTIKPTRKEIKKIFVLSVKDRKVKYLNSKVINKDTVLINCINEDESIFKSLGNFEFFYHHTTTKKTNYTIKLNLYALYKEYLKYIYEYFKKCNNIEKTCKSYFLTSQELKLIISIFEL